MKYPARVVTPAPYVSTKWRLPPMGWLFVYTMAALMAGVVGYLVLG